jgi:hypothetical protein
MLTSTILVMFVTMTRPPQASESIIRGSQPSPQRIQALKTTIQKRRQWQAKRRLIGVRNRVALYQELMANNRLQGTADRPALNVPWGDPFNLQSEGASRETLDQLGRGDPFGTSGDEAEPFNPCFT